MTNFNLLMQNIEYNLYCNAPSAIVTHYERMIVISRSISGTWSLNSSYPLDSNYAIKCYTGVVNVSVALSPAVWKQHE